MALSTGQAAGVGAIVGAVATLLLTLAATSISAASLVAYNRQATALEAIASSVRDCRSR